MEPSDISVIVPTFQRHDILRKTLNGLLLQTYPLTRFEVLVICDGPDPAAKAVTESFLGTLPVRYYEQPKQGVSAARNLGVELSCSPVVLFIDDDVIPGPECVACHARFHLQNEERETALLGYVTWHPDLPVTGFMRWYGEYGGLYGFALLQRDVLISPRFFYSCNVSVKRLFFHTCGGFDEALTVMEDNELAYRLTRHGLRLFYEPAAIGYHYQTFSFEQACQRLERYSSGLAMFVATAAGKVVAARRRRIPFRIAEAAVRILVPALAFLRPALDTPRHLPRLVYRMFYWYYGSFRSFWSRIGNDV